MYHRNSTKPNRLDRRKSTSAKSVHLEHIRPKMAEHHAQAAAMQAFARARERSSVEATLWPPPRNSDSNETNSHDGTPDRDRPSPAIRRQQSVRFVRERDRRSTEGHTALDDTISMKARNAMDGMEPRPIASASGAGMVSAAKGSAGDYINSLFTGTEYYTPEDDFASAPSSYRKIRKSKSMFTCSEASMTSENHVQTPISTAMNQLPPSSAGSANVDMGGSIRSFRLKAPKSMSFLRGRRDLSMLSFKRRGSIPVPPPTDENAGYSGNKDKPLKSKPSSFLRPKSVNTDKVFRKSMRDVSNDTILISGKLPKDGSLRNRARKVSLNFKHRLKNLFSLGKGDSDKEAFPAQQIEASKSHVADDDFVRINEFHFDPKNDDAAFSRVPSGVPSLHAVPSNQQLRSRQGSVKSFRSERRFSDDRSRVTSWSTSDTNTINTLSSRKGEWDRQRLSVIKENGMHVSSSSARYPSVANFAIDPNNSRSAPPPMPIQPATVNSQRIYSALMKRLGKTNKHSKNNELKRKKSVDNFITTSVIPPRGSSQLHDGRRPNSPATIRHIISDGLSDTSSTRTIERKPVANSGRAKDESNESYHIETPSTKSGIPSSASMPLGDEARRSVDIDAWKSSIPRIKEPTPSARTLSTRSSAFFASPTCHLFRTRSPYRRALQDSMRVESQDKHHDTHLGSPESNPWMRPLTGLGIRCPSTCDSEMDMKMRYTESVYSSTDDLRTEPSSAVDRFPRPPNKNHGDATIFLSPPVYRPTLPSLSKHRATSSASSVEWKTWLSANVSKLEGTSDRTDNGIIEYAVPKMGTTTRASCHVREMAQINGDDDEEQSLPPSPFHPNIEVYKPTRPEPDTALAPIEQNAITSPPTAQCQSVTSKQALKKSPSPISHDGNGNDKENEVPERITLQKVRNALRATPSLVSIRSFQNLNPASEPSTKGPFDSTRCKSLAHRASMNTLAGNSSMGLGKWQQGPRKYVTPTPSPGPKATGDELGCSTGSRRRFALASASVKKAENVCPMDVETDPFAAGGSGGKGKETGKEFGTMGSKKMVDLFLSSRRRRIASGEEGSVFM